MQPSDVTIRQNRKRKLADDDIEGTPVPVHEVKKCKNGSSDKSKGDGDHGFGLSLRARAERQSLKRKLEDDDIEDNPDKVRRCEGDKHSRELHSISELSDNSHNLRSHVTARKRCRDDDEDEEEAAAAGCKRRR